MRNTVLTCTQCNASYEILENVRGQWAHSFEALRPDSLMCPQCGSTYKIASAPRPKPQLAQDPEAYKKWIQGVQESSGVGNFRRLGTFSMSTIRSMLGAPENRARSRALNFPSMTRPRVVCPNCHTTFGLVPQSVELPLPAGTLVDRARMQSSPYNAEPGLARALMPTRIRDAAPRALSSPYNADQQKVLHNGKIMNIEERDPPQPLPPPGGVQLDAAGGGISSAVELKEVRPESGFVLDLHDNTRTLYQEEGERDSRRDSNDMRTLQ